MSDDDRLEDTDESVELECFCMSLVSMEQYEPVLHKVFSHAAGRWHRVADILSVTPDLAQSPNSELLVTWITAPVPDDGSYAVLVFYVFSEIWSFTAYYNRTRVLDETR